MTDIFLLTIFEKGEKKPMTEWGKKERKRERDVYIDIWMKIQK